jgi:predicted ATP-dependent endonuclease of OLD family
MRLIWVELQGFRRFEAKSRMNVDSKLVAIVGPNESGKSSFLKALLRFDELEPFVSTGAGQELTRGANIPSEQTVISAGFLLEDGDRAAVAHVPGCLDLRWFIMSKKATAPTHYIRLVPSISRPVELRNEVLADLRKILNDEVYGRVSEQEDEIDEELTNQANITDSFEELADDLEEATETISKELLAKIKSVAESLEHEMVQGPHYIKGVQKKLLKLATEESQPHPESTARSILYRRRPPFLFFSDEARALKSEYDLQEIADEAPPALQNLAKLANLDLAIARDLIESGDHGALETLQERANYHLKQVMAESWTQSKIVVRIRIDGQQLRVLVGGEGAPYVSIAERSDGLRQFVALLSFVASERGSEDSILLIDELETHLHYDAQADLVQMLSRQRLTRKVIYSTHSLGCLPEDLGTGVRLLEPIAPATSSIRDWFWEGEGKGFSPLLFGMGARTLAFVPVRYSLLTEGITDLLLLPSLLREATTLESLGFQVVPGLATASADEVALLEHGAPRTAYLVDSDPGGDEISRKLKRAGINGERIFRLPKRNGSALVIEDLLAPKVYVAAIQEELRRSLGTQFLFPEPELPITGRPQAIEAWCHAREISPPKKRAVAYRVLEARSDGPILAEEYREPLRELFASIRDALIKGEVSIEPTRP